MSATGAGFDRLAGIYRLLELVSFGHDLERARFAFLDRLAGCRRILVLGEGDGRCLARLVASAPGAHVDCVDISGAMLARAAGRLAPADRARVAFHHADALRAPFPAGPYDAVTTMFFLDCFTGAELELLVPRIAAALAPSAPWLWADFRTPDRGVARLWARVWVGVLYAFFRWQTGISARVLPPAEAAIEAAGFVAARRRDFQGGMVRAVLFERAVPPAARHTPDGASLPGGAPARRSV